MENVEWLHRGDVRLAIHRWLPEAPRAVAFYIHGIQSHAGWLFETGAALATSDVAVYALDRRGSGKSGGSRGDVESLDILFSDYVQAIGAVRRRHPDLPLTLVGQSLGGGILAGLVTSGHAPYDALVFCAPALGQMRVKLSESERERVRANETTLPEPVLLKDADYTADPRYLAFMGNDELMLRTITGRTRKTLLELEELYMNGVGRWRAAPVAFASPRVDPIIRLDAARTAFGELTNERGIMVEFPSQLHYLEFSPCRDRFWSWLIGYVRSGGYVNPS
jgi:alpha-beta hydrolase superfamily lysophospholipase